MKHNLVTNISVFLPLILFIIYIFIYNKLQNNYFILNNIVYISFILYYSIIDVRYGVVACLFIVLYNINIHSYNNDVSMIEGFDYDENSNKIISILNKAAGFYSQFFFVLNHYIYCKKNKTDFEIESFDWAYLAVNGWEDYFIPVRLNFNNSTNIRRVSHTMVLETYSIKEYQDVIPEIYRYNKKTIQEIKLYKSQFNLIENEYDFIYIRRGDKITTGEAVIVDEYKYLKLLLNKNPNCKTIFLQTDDYICYTRINDYIEKHNLTITVFTNSNPTDNGATKANIESLNKDDIYKHTINLLTSVDISRYSKTCVVDYKSNVSRFIKLFHQNPANVYDVNNLEVNYETHVCPAHGWE